MNQTDVFAMALGLAGTPWTVENVDLDTQSRPGRLNIHLDFKPGSRFDHPESKKPCSVYDSAPRSWRHLNFFQYECHVHAPLPRVDGGEGFGVKTIHVPWASPGSGFTLLMEAMMVLLAQGGMTIAEAARIIGENDHRLWRVLHRHVDQAHQKMDVNEVTQFCVDETSVRRGHDYVTVFCEPSDGDKPTRVLMVAEGKDSGTLGEFRKFLDDREVPNEQIQEICADMSAAYTAGVKAHFPDARLVYDFFHVVGLITSAVDNIRRRESKEFPELLKGTRFMWLKNEENLSEAMSQRRRELCGSKLKTAKAHCHLAAFQDLLRARDPADAIAGLRWWYNWVCHSRIPEMIKVAKTIKKHWGGLVAYIETRLTNGPMEAINGIIQTAKRNPNVSKNTPLMAAVHQ